LLEVGAVTFAHDGDAVVVALLVMHFLANRHAGNQRGVPFGGELAHHPEVALDGLLEHRHGRFRPYQQVDTLGAEAHVAVQRQLCIELLGVPLHALFDVTLDRRHAQRVAGR